jgi:hypothetical protein
MNEEDKEEEEESNGLCISKGAYFITLISIQECTKRGTNLSLFHTIYTHATQIQLVVMYMFGGPLDNIHHLYLYDMVTY